MRCLSISIHHELSSMQQSVLHAAVSAPCSSQIWCKQRFVSTGLCKTIHGAHPLHFLYLLDIMLHLYPYLEFWCRLGAGSRYKKSKLPKQPLELWAYELSPFCKVCLLTGSERLIACLYTVHWLTSGNVQLCASMQHLTFDCVLTAVRYCVMHWVQYMPCPCLHLPWPVLVSCNNADTTQSVARLLQPSCSASTPFQVMSCFLC